MTLFYSRMLAVVAILLTFSWVEAQEKPAMVRLEGGSYMMGSDESPVSYEKPAHKVTLKPFMIAKKEVTLAEYDRFCESTNRPLVNDRNWGRGDRPAIHVSWYDAVRYCNWLSAQEGLKPAYKIEPKATGNPDVLWDESANGYRLPTEAEWEYAARGGNQMTPTLYAGSNQPRTVANFFLNEKESRTQPVASKKPNELGLFDMSGNVWEWVWDIYAENYYRKSGSFNPKGPEKGNQRVARGGSWFSDEYFIRVYARTAEAPEHLNSNVGFRVARNAQ